METKSKEKSKSPKKNCENLKMWFERLFIDFDF